MEEREATRARVCVCARVRARACAYVCVRARARARACVCVCVCVCVAFGIQHAMRMRHTLSVTCPALHFPHYLINVMTFGGGGVEHKMCLDFSTTFV